MFALWVWLSLSIALQVSPFNQAGTAPWDNPRYHSWQQHRCAFSSCCQVKTNYLDFFYVLFCLVFFNDNSTYPEVRVEMSCYFHLHVVVCHFKIHSQMTAETPWGMRLHHFCSVLPLHSSCGFLIKDKFKAKRKSTCKPLMLLPEENVSVEP